MHPCINAYTCMHACTHANTHFHICTHACIYTYMHTSEMTRVPTQPVNLFPPQLRFALLPFSSPLHSPPLPSPPLHIVPLSSPNSLIAGTRSNITLTTPPPCSCRPSICRVQDMACLALQAIFQGLAGRESPHITLFVKFLQSRDKILSLNSDQWKGFLQVKYIVRSLGIRVQSKCILQLKHLERSWLQSIRKHARDFKSTKQLCACDFSDVQFPAVFQRGGALL